MLEYELNSIRKTLFKTYSVAVIVFNLVAFQAIAVVYKEVYDIVFFITRLYILRFMIGFCCE